MITPVILSGGSGTRLWPLSRNMYPKQLLSFSAGDETLLQQTIRRTEGIADIGSPIIVCNEEHRFMVADQLQQVGCKKPTIILEPFGRNTAPAIALAALSLAETDPDALMLVMPADHSIEDVYSFQNAVQESVETARQGAIVTFGICPTEANTAYGYIKAEQGSVEKLKSVLAFTEKPDVKVAERYMEEGGYFWNGGIFLMTADTYLRELQEYVPEILVASQKAMAGARVDLDFIRIDENEFSESPDLSIDYALMERTDKATLIALDAGWTDLGSWSALWDVADKDESSNAIFGDVVTCDTFNSTIFSHSRLVATLGVKDLVVVETSDAVLVCDRGQSQKIKDVVGILRADGRIQADNHRKVHRPWGWYDSLEMGDGFQVKRIQLKPLARISVQSHKFRAEHWVVISGIAEVLKGDEIYTLIENESTLIPVGMKHSLCNPSEDQTLDIIEVQTGSYLGEDDIERFEDQYGRIDPD